jgi:putative peptide zinc metalloprotease protein
MFMPRLYTDLTDAWQLNRMQRFFTAAAGIIFELIVGGIAILLWSNTTPGVLHSICFYLFTISIINTLIFNGNPFMRFDGYYMLSDLLGIKNLQQKSMAIFKTFIRTYLWGIKTPKILRGAEMEHSRSLQQFMFIYAIGTFFYRIFLYASIIMLIYTYFFKLLGIVLATLGIYSLFIKPIMREITFINMKATGKNKIRAKIIYVLIIALVIGGLFIPIPLKERFPCTFNALNRDILYVKTPGFLKHLNVKTGDVVAINTVITTLENPPLEIDYQRSLYDYKIGKIEELSVRYDKRIMRQSSIIKKRLNSLQAICNEKKSQLDKLTIRAKIPGIFMMYNETEMGRWFSAGEAFGEICTKKKTVLHIFVEYDAIKNIQKGDIFSIYPQNSISPFNVSVAHINRNTMSTSLNPAISILLKKENRFKNKQFYHITCSPVKPQTPFLIGRTGHAEKIIKKSLFSIISKRIFLFFHSEF